MWNINIDSAINQCAELVDFDYSKIELDIMIVGENSRPTLEGPSRNAFKNWYNGF